MMQIGELAESANYFEAAVSFMTPVKNATKKVFDEVSASGYTVNVEQYVESVPVAMQKKLIQLIQKQEKEMNLQ